MEKRYQVFVSSTYRDLGAERAAVIQTLLEMDCIPAGMELFPASDHDAWTLIKAVIDDCDYYLLVVGGRYGSVDAAGLSFTEHEYDYALSRRKPIIAFLHQDPGKIAAEKTERDPHVAEKLEAFRKKAETRLCRYWRSPDDLGALVAKSLNKLIKSHPAPGWVKGDQLAAADALEQINKLRKRAEELEAQLDRSRLEPPEGTEGLAQGDDTYQIDYELSYYNNNGEEWVVKLSTPLTWNFLLSLTGPALLREPRRDEIKNILEEFIVSYRRQDWPSDVDHDERLSVVVDEFDLDDILLQFKALGIAKLSDRKRAVSDTNAYWALTPYGEMLVTRLRAIRRDPEE